MADFIRAAITFVLSNFPLTFFVIGLIASLIAIAWSPAPLDAATIVEKLISWHVFFALGVTYLYNFVFHVFFGKMAAAFIGWADSPFQFEVGMASLGFSAVAFMAAFRSFDLRLAAILGSSVFLLGAAAGHICRWHGPKFAPRNAGIIFCMDIMFAGRVRAAWVQHRYGRPAARPLYDRAATVGVQPPHRRRVDRNPSEKSK
jgi:hypothetical protein